jgi:hypothetical protein
MNVPSWSVSRVATNCTGNGGWPGNVSLIRRAHIAGGRAASKRSIGLPVACSTSPCRRSAPPGVSKAMNGSSLDTSSARDRSSTDENQGSLQRTSMMWRP